jgi:hypothetical protein
LSNNTSGASIYDLGNFIKAESISEVEQIMKSIEEKTSAQRQEEMQMQQQMEQQRIQGAQEQQLADQQFRSTEADKDRRNDLMVAQIRASGYGATVDLNENQQSDYLDAMERLEQQHQYQEQMQLKRQQEVNKTQLTREQLNLKREEMSSKERIAEKQVQIARVNKNRYDQSTKTTQGQKDNPKK